MARSRLAAHFVVGAALSFSAACVESSDFGESSTSAASTSATTDSSATNTETGSDSDSDSDSAIPACPARVVEGDFAWPVDHSALDGVTEVIGALDISVENVGALALPCLETIRGGLKVHGAGVPAHAILPRLVSVDGDLYFENLQSSIALHLAPRVARVGGSLVVANNPELASLAGLENLQSIGSQLLIGRNAKLTQISALSGLLQAQEVLVIENPSLVSMEGLGPVARLERLKVAKNGSLRTLAGIVALEWARAVVVSENPLLADLSAISGLLAIEDELEIEALPALKDLHFLRALQVVPHAVRIVDNSGLASLAGLESWTTIPEASVLVIEDNANLQRLEGLDNLRRIEGQLHLRNNAALSDISALSGLEFAQTLSIVGPDQLTSMRGLDALVEVGDVLTLGRHSALGELVGLRADVVVQKLKLFELDVLASIAETAKWKSLNGLSMSTMPALDSLAGLENRRELPHGLTLRDLPSLPSLAGIGELQQVGEMLILENLPGLVDFSGFEGLTDLGGLIVAHQPNIKSLRGLQGISGTLHGPLCIHQNPNLLELDALSGISEVDASLSISLNDALSSADGLRQVTRIGSSLWLNANPALKSLRGFASVREVGGEVWSVGDDCASVLGGSRHGFMGIEIYDMPMTSLDGLEAVDTVKGGLMVKENKELSDVRALAGMHVGGEILEVLANPKLDQCAALAVTSELVTFEGDVVRIQDNLGPDDPACR
jgi:hypothetical protein